MVKLNKLLIMSIMFLGCFASVNAAGMAGTPMSAATAISKTPWTNFKNKLNSYRRIVLGKSNREKEAELIPRVQKLAGYTDLADAEAINALADHNLALNKEKLELSCLLPNGTVKTVKLTSNSENISTRVWVKDKLLGIYINDRYIWIPLAKLEDTLQAFCNDKTLESIKSINNDETESYDLIFRYGDENDRDPNSAAMDGSIVTFKLDKKITCLSIVDNDFTYRDKLDELIAKIKDKETIKTTEMNMYLNILAEKMDVRAKARKDKKEEFQKELRKFDIELKKAQRIYEDKEVSFEIPRNIQKAIDSLAENEDRVKNTPEQSVRARANWAILQRSVKAGLVPKLKSKLAAKDALRKIDGLMTPELKQKIKELLDAYQEYPTKISEYLVTRESLYSYITGNDYDSDNDSIIECGSQEFQSYDAEKAIKIIGGLSVIVLGAGIIAGGTAGGIALIISGAGTLNVFSVLAGIAVIAGSWVGGCMIIAAGSNLLHS